MFSPMQVRNGLGTSFRSDALSEMGRLYDLVGVRGSIHLGTPLKASIASELTRRPHRYRSDLYAMI